MLNYIIMNQRLPILFLILIVFLSKNLFSEEIKADLNPVKVSSLEFKIEGKTQPYALERVMKIYAGMKFDNRAELEDFLDREIQELINLRIFTIVESDIQFKEDPDGIDLADITVSVKDTWSIYPFIVPNSQGEVTLVTMAVVDKNFLGSLTELRLSGDFGIGRDPVNQKIEIPRWGVYLDWLGVTFKQWEFSAKLIFQHKTERKFLNEEIIEDYSYFRTEYYMDIRYEFPFLRNLYYHMIPTIGWRHGYDVRIDSGEIEYEYFYLGLGQAVDYRKIDWHGFYRQGWSLGILNAIWGADEGSENQMNTTVTGRVSGYGVFGIFNPNARMLAHYSINNEGTGLGRFVRGVRDDDMYGNKVFAFNTSVQIRLYEGVFWEPHIQPFIDFGIASESDEYLDWDEDLNIGIGAELLVFFPKLPSLQLRGQLGFNAMIPSWSSDRKWEAGLSLNLFY